KQQRQRHDEPHAKPRRRIRNRDGLDHARPTDTTAPGAIVIASHALLPTVRAFHAEYGRIYGEAHFAVLWNTGAPGDYAVVPGYLQDDGDRLPGCRRAGHAGAASRQEGGASRGALSASIAGEIYVAKHEISVTANGAGGRGDDRSGVVRSRAKLFEARYKGR